MKELKMKTSAQLDRDFAILTDTQGMKGLRFDFKKYREKKGINQRDLALKAKVQQCTISRYESGLQDISMPTLVRLAKAIGSKELTRLIQRALISQLG